MKVKNLFRKPVYPIELYDSSGNKIYSEDSNGWWAKWEHDANGNRIYFEDSDGWWVKREYDANGNKIYYENSNGDTLDNRPTPETILTMDEIAKKFNIPISQLKIKKQ